MKIGKKKMAEKKTVEQRTAEIWEKRMTQTLFAMIETNKTIYDRVAVVFDFPTKLTVQYPKGSVIRQDDILKKDIIQIKYYENEYYKYRERTCGMYRCPS